MIEVREVKTIDLSPEDDATGELMWGAKWPHIKKKLQAEKDRPHAFKLLVAAVTAAKKHRGGR